MAQIHDDFEKAILQCRFKKDYNKQYDYQMYDGTWFYKLKFEGYAYVLYKEINIYVKPLMSLFKIYNKFAKGTAQIGLHYAVPIAHFGEPQKLIDIIAILTDKLDEKAREGAYVDCLVMVKEASKNLVLADVSGRSELLKAFAKYWNGERADFVTIDDCDIEDFLSL